MTAIVRDLRTAFRALSRKPGVTMLAVASLALAIGFSTAAFSVLDAYALRDMPVADPERLVWVSVLTRENRPDILSWPEYQAMVAGSHQFTGLIAQNRRGPRVRLADHDEFPITCGVSDNFFDLLNVRAAMGSVFRTGKGADGTVVLSHRYWQRAFHGDPAIVGKTVAVGAATLTVMGVLPPAFLGTVRGIAVDLVVPSQVFFGSLDMSRPNAVRFVDYEVLGRLRPGATLEQARAELNGILRQVERDGNAPAPERKAVVDAFADKGLMAKLDANAMFLGIIGLLVLIAAANLANLRLVDNEQRRRETGIRLALGAGANDLARRHVLESLLLGLMGTAAGLVLAAWLIGAAPALFYGGDRFKDFGIRLDGRTFAFSSAALIAVSLIGALIPLSDAWRRRVLPSMQAARTTASSRWLAGLVIAQMALVTGVTCSAGLLWRSLQNVAAIRPAMDPEARLLMVPGFWAGDGVKRTGELAERVASLPGVKQVAWARRALLSGSLGGATVEVELAAQPKMSFRYNQVSPNYFSATGARVFAGRAFEEGDGAEATPVIMVNQTFVRQFFGGEGAVGRWVRVSGKDRQVVGVVEDGPTISLREKAQPYLYLPFAQRPNAELTLFVQMAAGDPAQMAGPVRSTIREFDRSFTVLDTLTMGQHLRNARSTEQMAMEVTGGLALVGLLLAGAGLFGVTLFAVARRMPEFGLRVAMGATPAILAVQVLREAGGRILIALPLGWGLTYVGRNAIAKMLYGVAADDWRIWAVASVVVSLVGAAAALNPAMRAARVDPMTALRHE